MDITSFLYTDDIYIYRNPQKDRTSESSLIKWGYTNFYHPKFWPWHWVKMSMPGLGGFGAGLGTDALLGAGTAIVGFLEFHQEIGISWGFSLQSQNLKGKTEGRWGVMSISWKIFWCGDKMIYGLFQHGGFTLKSRVTWMGKTSSIGGQTRIQSFKNWDFAKTTVLDNEKEWDWTAW